MMPITSNPCDRAGSVSKEYCRKLRAGLTRLRVWIRSDYEAAFPDEHDQIAEAVREAEEAAWITPFPALFFPPLAHLKVQERLAQA